MILSAITHKDSPFVRIQFLRPGKEKKEYFKTTIRKDDPDRKRKVALELNRIARELLSDDPDSNKQKDSGWSWVGPWLRRKYRATASTLKAYERQWDAITPFIDDIHGPASLTREDCFTYADWRTAQVKEKSRKNISINTALAELKLLGMVVDEAIKRGMAVTNPARKMGVKRDEPGVKPEFSESDLAKIRTAFNGRPEWMRTSFEIALATGLRFSDTRIPRDAVNLTEDVIYLEKPKGGRRKAFSIPIYESIRPMISDFMASKQKFIWDPADKTPASIHWLKFWREVGIRGACFHCSRVTFITRGMRAGIPESVMMRMVNHGSKLISRIYQRWNVEDVRRFAGLINPVSGDATKQSPPEKPSRETQEARPA